MTKIQIKLSLESAVVEVDTDELQTLIQNAIDDRVAYVLRDQISAQLNSWCAEIMNSQREAILERLKPEIEKRLANVRLSDRY